MADERRDTAEASDEVDARVVEAAREDTGQHGRGERMDLPTPEPAPASFAALSADAPLAVDEAQRRVPPEPKPFPPEHPSAMVRRSPEPESPVERGLRWRRRALIFVVLLLIAGGGVVLLAHRPEGEGVLPQEVRGAVREASRSVTSRVPGADAPLYTFTDDQGVVHIVDDLEKVPSKYRKQARESR